MKKHIIFLLSCAAFFSCNNEVDNLSPAGNGPEINNTQLTKMDTGEAQKEFARVLSKAVYNNQQVRDFLKKEAIKQFDNDYDIFYPFIKDKVVAGDETFRDILLSYCDDETSLLSIEETLPLLNILVPDLTLFGDFNAHQWDTTDQEVGVSYREGNKEGILYGDGEVVANLSSDEIPGFPVLVVKNNERLQATVATKSAEGTTQYAYEFISDAYNRELTPETKSDGVINLNPADADNFLPASEVDASIVQAYQESKKNPYALDRDYIYYGLSQAHPKDGTLNPNIRESIYKFKIDFRKYTNIADQSEDPRLQDVENKISELTNSQIINRIWTDGYFEIVFDVYMGQKDQGAAQTQSIHVSLKPQELFDINKINVHYRHKTKFRHTKYTYSVQPSELRSKWVSLKRPGINNEIFTAPWDLTTKSLSITILMYEKDQSETITKTESIGHEFASNINSSTTVNIGKTTNKTDVGINTKYTQTSTVTNVKTKESDDLGRVTSNFCDPVILREDTKNGVSGYRIFTINNATVEIMMLPVRLR